MTPMGKHKNLLIVDDDENVTRSLCRLLKSEPYDVVALHNPLDAIELAGHRCFDVLLSDNRMPKMSGVELMTHFFKIQPGCRRISMSAYQDFDSLIHAFNHGYVEHFVQKPWTGDTLKALLARYLSPEQPEVSADVFDRILTESNSMLRIFEKVSALRDHMSPVFIYGETGTGKELIARALHDQSGRSKRDFVAVNCSNLNSEIMESQLFGHTKGSFTGAIKNQSGLLEAADGGTLFLDEVTDLSHTVQSKLLRALQEREFMPVGATKAKPFDARIISASSTRMRDAVENGQFRADLMYRLEVIPIELPPLRERHSDVLMLFKHFSGCNEISHETASILEAYHWPGNVRELQNAASYSRAFATDQDIRVDHLPDSILHSFSNVSDKARPSHPLTKTMTGKCCLDINDIKEALRLSDNNRSAAARTLGVSRMTLWRYMTNYGLT